METWRGRPPVEMEGGREAGMEGGRENGGEERRQFDCPQGHARRPPLKALPAPSTAPLPSLCLIPLTMRCVCVCVLVYVRFFINKGIPLLPPFHSPGSPLFLMLCIHTLVDEKSHKPIQCTYTRAQKSSHTLKYSREHLSLSF